MQHGDSACPGHTPAIASSESRYSVKTTTGSRERRSRVVNRVSFGSPLAVSDETRAVRLSSRSSHARSRALGRPSDGPQCRPLFFILCAGRFVFVEAEIGRIQSSASDVVAPFTIASRRLRDAASAATEDSALAKHRTDQRKPIARDAEVSRPFEQSR